MTPKKSFELTVIGLMWVISIFRIPGLPFVFGFVIVWAVIGFRSAVKVALIGGIPDLIQAAISQVAFFYSVLPSINKILAVPNYCKSLPLPKVHDHYSIQFSQCVGSHLQISGYLSFLNTVHPPAQISNINPIWGILVEIGLFVFLGWSINKRIKMIRKRLNGMHTFRQMRQKHEATPPTH